MLTEKKPIANPTQIQMVEKRGRELRSAITVAAWRISHDNTPGGARHIIPGAMALAAEEISVRCHLGLTARELLSALRVLELRQAATTRYELPPALKPEPITEEVNEPPTNDRELSFARRYREWCRKNDFAPSDRCASTLGGVDYSLPSYAREELKKQGFSFEPTLNGWLVENPRQAQIRALKEQRAALDRQIAELEGAK